MAQCLNSILVNNAVSAGCLCSHQLRYAVSGWLLNLNRCWGTFRGKTSSDGRGSSVKCECTICYLLHVKPGGQEDLNVSAAHTAAVQLLECRSLAFLGRQPQEGLSIWPALAVLDEDHALQRDP